ncbi:MAG: MFS transporter [Eubacteriales bacterium]|nr:MFS transporter [Eubacteriales bacterium]
MLGLVSFFVDVSTEMVYPLIPIYLTTALGATPAIVGIIEGIAESLASLLKIFSGYCSDKYKRKKPLAYLGYSTAVFYKLALIVSTSWIGVLAARVIDRFGKGIRTTPRDVLVSESADKNCLGKAFGLHKALDMAGSATGVLLAYFLMSRSTGDFDYKKVFLISIVPAIIGVAVLIKVKEKKQTCESKKPLHLIQGFKQLDSRLKLFLITAFVFTLGNSSNAFLLLRAQNLGYDATDVILLYFLYSVVSSALAVPFGKLSDKIGRRKILVGGYIAFALVYFGFAAATHQTTAIVLFAVYGIYTALTAGVERALIAEISPKELKGSVLGLHASLVGIALLPASIIAGFLWDAVCPAAPFYLGAGLALVSAVSICIILKEKRQNS